MSHLCPVQVGAGIDAAAAFETGASVQQAAEGHAQETAPLRQQHAQCLVQWQNGVWLQLRTFKGQHEDEDED